MIHEARPMACNLSQMARKGRKMMVGQVLCCNPFAQDIEEYCCQLELQGQRLLF
jgi:Fe-S-cluster containining protein